MFALALRNVVRHRGHSLLLAALFALASLLFISGNSLLAHVNRTLRQLFVQTITGDFVIAAASDAPMSLFGAITPSIGELIPIPLLAQPGPLADRLAALPGVHGVTPVISGAALLDVPGRRVTVPLFGIEPQSYFAVLPGIEVTAGRALNPGESGIMLTESLARRLASETGNAIQLGDELLLTAAQGARFRIRSAPLVGLFRYPVSMDFSDEITLVDAATLLALNEIQVLTSQPDAAGDDPFGPADIDDLFAGVPDADPDADLPDTHVPDTDPGSDTSSGITVEDVLARALEPPAERSAAGFAPAPADAHFLLARGSATAAVRAIATETGTQLLSWRQAAGQTAMLALLLRVVFNGGFVIFIIAVTLAAANIVLISTYRRTREIGTLRAIGAELPSIRRMFLLEHALIGAAGWLIGLSAALAASAVVARRGPAVSNRLIAMLVGGHRLRLPIDPATAALCLLVVTAIVCLAVVIPLRQVIQKPIVEAIREHR